MIKLKLALLICCLGVNAYAANWQGVYEIIDSALSAQQQGETQNINSFGEPAADSAARSAIQYSGEPSNASGNTTSSPKQPLDADTLLREYLSNASDNTLLSLIHEKGLQNDLTIRYQNAVSDGNRRVVYFARNQIVDMLATLYPYESEQ